MVKENKINKNAETASKINSTEAKAESVQITSTTDNNDIPAEVKKNFHKFIDKKIPMQSIVEVENIYNIIAQQLFDNSKGRNFIRNIEEDNSLFPKFDVRCYLCPSAISAFDKYIVKKSKKNRLIELILELYKQAFLAKLVEMPNRDEIIEKDLAELSEAVKKARKSAKRKAFIVNQILILSYAYIFSLIDIKQVDICGNRFFDERCYTCPIIAEYRDFLLKQKIFAIDKEIRLLNSRLDGIEVNFNRKLITKEKYEQSTEKLQNEIAKLEEEKIFLKSKQGKDKWLIDYQISQDRQWLQRKAEYDSKQNDRKEM